MKIVLPKDEVVAALSAENKLLKKQIAALKAQVTKSESKVIAIREKSKYSGEIIKRIGEFKSKFKGLMEEYFDLHGLTEFYEDNGP